MAYVIFSMDVTSVSFALKYLFWVHGNGQSQLYSSSKSPIASAKAQQQMNNWMYLHWGLTYFPYLEPVLTLNCATLVSNKLFLRVDVINFRVGSLDLLIAWMAFVILSMDVTSVPFALNDLFRVHGNGQSQLSSSSKSTIASEKA